MRIKELMESTEELDPKVLSKIINSKFFELNWKPMFDQNMKSKDSSSLFYYPSTMLHGGRIEPNKLYDIKERKKSSDSSPILHKLINKISMEKLGVPVRNFLFSSLSDVVTGEYGRVSIIVPVEDDYELYFSTIVDDMFTSNKVFNKKDFKNDVLRIKLKKFFNQDSIKKLLNEIEGFLTTKKEFNFSKMFFELLMHGHPFGLSTLLSSTDNPDDDINTLKEFVTEYNISRGSEEILDVIVDDYNMSEENHEKLKTYTTKLSKSILEFEIAVLKKWVIKEASRYVDSIEKTQLLSDIKGDHEIMSTSGVYATLPIRNGLEELYQYYKNSQ